MDRTEGQYSNIGESLRVALLQLKRQVKNRNSNINTNIMAFQYVFPPTPRRKKEYLPFLAIKVSKEDKVVNCCSWCPPMDKKSLIEQNLSNNIEFGIK